MKRNILILLSLLFSTLILTSCVSYYNYDENKINITATTNIMGNLAEIIGDERVNVYSLMGAGIVSSFIYIYYLIFKCFIISNDFSCKSVIDSLFAR